jgi:N-acetylmuramoyl-L-alanine amidase
MSKKIEQYLVSKGATVYLTRETDIDLSTSNKNKKRSALTNRAKLINNANCDIYISIHLNYISNSKWQGLQVFYNNKNKS